MPAAMYALRAGPRTPGAWPSTWSVRPVCSFATSFGSPAITPGKFIISATPMVRCRRRRLSMSPVVKARCGDSNFEAGTDDEAMTKTSSGKPAREPHDPRSRGAALDTIRLAALLAAEPDHVPVGDRHVHLEPFLREDREHPAAREHEVGGLVPARPGHPTRGPAGADGCGGQ